MIQPMKKALLDISVAPDEIIHSNQLYISPDLIAFSMPGLISDTDYLTIDPATFTDEWTAKGLDEDMLLMDLQEYVHTIFGKKDGDEINSQLASQISDLFADLSQRAVFSEDGTVEDSISGTNYKMDIMTYTFSEDDVNDFYQELLSVIKKDAASRENLLSYRNIGHYWRKYRIFCTTRSQIWKLMEMLLSIITLTRMAM